MDRTERFYKIDQLLRDRRSTPLDVIIDELDVSRATVKRDIEYLRDRLHAPIVWDRSLRGYRYEVPADDQPAWQLPGLWFNASELHALVTMEHLLSELQPELLSTHIQPLRSLIRKLLEQGDHSADEVVNRIKVLHMNARAVEPTHFQVIARALLQRKRLSIRHFNRGNGETSERSVSPQRLVYYRDNWYLDTWCHARKALRSFSVDAIHGAFIEDVTARSVAESTLDTVLGSGYGIFSGDKTRTALLRFRPERARWVSREQWHPQQEGRFDDEGYYLLSFPYSNDTELVMDILRHVPNVEVLKPATLRRRVRECLQSGLDTYR